MNIQERYKVLAARVGWINADHIMGPELRESKVREETGRGLMDCREALKRADGDVEVAIRLLTDTGSAFNISKMHRI